MNALTPLGMVSELPSENQTNEFFVTGPGAEREARSATTTSAGVGAGVAADVRADVDGAGVGAADAGAADAGVAVTGAADDERKDYFVERDGMRFAGTHLLVDLWEAGNLGDPAHIDAALREAAVTAGATILHSHFHHFSPNGGVSGVVVLAESHISIHTWPERDFAAVDIFMCGACDPHLAVPVLQRAFGPGRIELGEQRRGRVA